jgi:hypothetical protein
MFSLLNKNNSSSDAQALSYKLREIDVNNENHNNPDNLSHSLHIVAKFAASDANQKFLSFLNQCNEAVKGFPRSKVLHSTGNNNNDLPQPICGLLELLDWIDSLIDQAPINKSNNQQRFGNPAFRSFLNLLQQQGLERIKSYLIKYCVAQDLPNIVKEGKAEPSCQHDERHEHSDNQSESTPVHNHAVKIHAKVLESLKQQEENQKVASASCSEGSEVNSNPESFIDQMESLRKTIDWSSPVAHDSDKINRIAIELCDYLFHSFGDIRRIDYGTGHELNFFCFLCSLHSLGLFPHQNSQETQFSLQCLTLNIFARYVEIMRRLEIYYFLEPAGSRGVWGLDDYCFLPFLLGSAQLIGHKYIKPKSIKSPDVLEGYKRDYLYLDSIDFINRVKTSSFALHSPMLYDISGIKDWSLYAFAHIYIINILLLCVSVLTSLLPLLIQTGI